MAALAKMQARKETSLLASPVTWAAVTILAGLLAAAVVQPSACASDKECVVKHEVVPTRFNAYSATGLVMVLVGETANLVSTFNGAKEAMSIIPDLRSRCLPSLLLAISFVVLIAESSVFAASTHPWFASVRPDLRAPVYTVTFIEWLIIVPMLLVMAGHCALGRPMREMGRPVILTNVYIIFAWVALMTTSWVLRWSLIATTFTMYGWASLDMVMWVADYLRVAPADLSSRGLRPCLALGLIAVFAIYAIGYMSVLSGIMGANTERMVFLVLNVGVKLVFSIAFVVIRGTEYHSTLTGVLKKLSTSNVAIVSILRGSFDILLPCAADAEGRCRLTGGGSGDVSQLEHALQRKVAGQSLGDLLADDGERARFAAYVRNAQRQSERPRAEGGEGGQPDWALSVGGSLPPVAQVLNCRLGFGGATSGGRRSVGCAVHLSVVPGSAHFGPGRQMVAAVRFTEESAASRPEEAAPAPEFQAFEPGSESDTADLTYSSEMSSEPKASSDDRMVASLMDVAKLGMSALLQSARSVSADGEGEESGYGESGFNDQGSFVDPKKPAKSTGTMSGPNRAGRARSVISEEESEGDSASVLRLDTIKEQAAPQVHAVGAPEKEVADQLSPRGAAGTADGGLLTSGPFERLTTLPEPEEERFSRSCTKELAVAGDGDPMPRRDGSPADLPSGDGKKVAYQSISAAASAMAREMMTDLETTPAKAAVTVTMQIAPMQFSLAVGTVALAACAAMLSSRRR